MVVLAVILFTIYGALIGVAAGLIISLALRRRVRYLRGDCPIGAIAFPLAFFLVIAVPWPENTIRYHGVISTMNRYQHPWWF